MTGATLTRFFAIHIALLPAIFTAILFVHLVFVQRQGMHEPEALQHHDPSRRRTIPFFPNFLLRDTLLWLIVLNVLLYLAVFFPWEIGEKADPFASAPQGIRPEWYFMFMFQTLKLLPAHVLFMEAKCWESWRSDWPGWPGCWFHSSSLKVVIAIDPIKSSRIRGSTS